MIFQNKLDEILTMQALKNKRKVSKKILQPNPNQLSLEFLQMESEIEIHLPKHKIKLDTSALKHTERSVITLSL